MNQSKNIISFISAVDSGNYRDAAKNLRVSLSTISRSINELEEDLNEKLFINVNGEYILTDIGKTLYSEVSKIDNNLNYSYESIKRETNSVTILMPPSLHRENLFRQLYKFNNDKSKSTYLRDISNYPSRVDAYNSLRNGKLDIFYDIEPSSSNSMICELAYEYDLYLIASINNKVNLDELENTDDLLFAKSNWLGNDGELLERILGIEKNKQTGLVTDNLRMYFNMIFSTNMIGMATPSILFLSEYSNLYKISKNPIGKSQIYFICTKASLNKKEIIKWIRSQHKSKQLIETW